MEGYRSAMKKRKKLDGVEFDVWAFNSAGSEQAKKTKKTKQLPGVWHLRSTDKMYVKNTGSLRLSVSQARYEKLKQMWVENDRFSSFEEALDACLLKYEPLHSGLQSACPQKVFDVLSEQFGCDTEVFAR